MSETPLEIFLDMVGRAAQRDPSMLCQSCGAGMTAVEVPGGKQLRAWIDHKVDCPASDGGVFIVDTADIRR